MSNPIILTLNTGATIPLRPAIAASGNEYFTILNPATGKAAGKFGLKVAPSVIGGNLPTSLTVLGKTVRGTKGTTMSGNVKVEFSAPVEVKKGDRRTLRFQVSQTPDGNFNVLGSVTRPGGAAKAVVTSL